jgi:hypothetical protein
MSKPRAYANRHRFAIGLLSIAAFMLTTAFWAGVPLSVPSGAHAAPPEGKGGGKGGGGGEETTTPTFTQIGLGLRGAGHINDSGDVVGTWYDGSVPGNLGAVIIPRDADGDGKPDTWFFDADGDGENDLITLLPTLPGHAHDSTGLQYYHGHSSNLAGQIVGTAEPGDLSDEPWHLILWQLSRDGSATVTDLGPMQDGLRADINFWGQVTGWHDGEIFVIDPLDVDGDGWPDTWFVDDGFGGNALMVSLGAGYWGWPAPRINDDGSIIANAGYYSASPQPVVIIPRDSNGDGAPDTWYADGDGDGFNDLEAPLPLARNSTGQAAGLNSNGQIVGTNPSLSTPVVWTVAADGSTKKSKLPVPKSIWQAEATAINDAGQIVGNGNSNQVPILWHDGEFFDLNELVTNGPAALIDAYAINRYGEILGRRKVNGFTESVLLIPNEPK